MTLLIDLGEPIHVLLSRKNITKLLTESLMPQVIKWPEHAQYLNMSTVFNTNGFEGIVGSIDGTH